MIPSYCYDRIKEQLRVINDLKSYKDLISANTIKDIKSAVNWLTDELKIDRTNLYNINDRNSLERLADNLHILEGKAAQDARHNVIVALDDLGYEFLRKALDQFHTCGGR